MSRSTKEQFYKYSLKTVAVAEQQGCTDKIYLYPVPPENALSIEECFVHFIFQFESDIPSHLQVLNEIGIANQRPILITDDPTDLRVITLDQAADGNRRIDIKIDLTTLLTPTNVGWTPEFGADYDDGDQTFIYLKFPKDLRLEVNTGTIELWKVDSVYTTNEIR